jgi:hypothetical protein
MAHTTLLAPPSFRDPSRVVEIDALRNKRPNGVSGADLADYRQQPHLIEASALSTYGEFSWTGQSLPGFDGAEVLRGLIVIAEYSRVFDQPMAAMPRLRVR